MSVFMNITESEGKIVAFIFIYHAVMKFLPAYDIMRLKWHTVDNRMSRD